jgi:sialidase-1
MQTIRSRRSALKEIGFLASAAFFKTGSGRVRDRQASSGEPGKIRARERESGAPGRQVILGRSDELYPRHSEGDLAPLADGSLLAVWSRFRAASDHAVAELVGRISEDGGLSWGSVFSVASLSEEQHRRNSNLMSASLLPLQSSNKLLLVYLGKEELEPGKTESDGKIRCTVYGRFTSDGRNFTDPFLISDLGHYYVVNNARVIQLSKGRLLVPCAVDLRPGREFGWSLQSCRTFYSDDQGATWRPGKPCSLRPEDYPKMQESRLTLQEPGLIELRDGRIFMVIRTRLGHPYKSISEDGGETWSVPKPIEQVVSPASPQTMFRLPTSGRVGMIYNNNPKGADTAWADRRPLAFAESKDEGESFAFRKVIEETECRAWSYPSCRQYGDAILLSYYEWMQGNPNFSFTDFKLSLIPVDWFES